MNEQPMTPEQLRQLERMAKEIQSRPGAHMPSNHQLCCTSASCRSIVDNRHTGLRLACFMQLIPYSSWNTR